MEKKNSWARELVVIVTGLAMVVLGLIVVLGTIGGIKVSQIRGLVAMGEKMKAAGPPPATVATATATAAEWENILQFAGSLKAVQGVTLTAEMPGRVVNIPVENGANVKKGDIIIELETTQERADLQAVEANLKLAKINYDRMTDLMQKRVISQ